MRPAAIVFVLVALGSSLPGCVSHRSLSANAVDYNLAVEEAQNRMLLLNVLRAREQRPLYLTSLSKITGSDSASWSLGLELPFKANGKGTPAGSFGVNPTYDVVVLDSKEFMTGFLKPVSPELFKYYWDLGWPQEFLLHLLVQKVELRVEEKNEVKSYYLENHPQDEDPALCKVEVFSRWVNQLVREADPWFEWEPQSEEVGPELEASTAATVENLVALDEKGMSLDETWSRKMQVHRRSKVLELKGEEDKLVALADWVERVSEASDAKESCPADFIHTRTAAKTEDIQETEMRSQQIWYDPDGGKRGESTATFRLTLRSPEALLYYLGQLARVQFRLNRPVVPRYCQGETPTPIFAVGTAHLASPSDAAVSVAYGGRVYYVPGGESSSPSMEPDSNLCHKDEAWLDNPLHSGTDRSPGESMHVLSLLSQVISLQKSAETTPTTSTVRVVGQP